MDSNLFHLDWERIFGVLATIATFSLFVERGLAVVFENKAYINGTAINRVRQIFNDNCTENAPPMSERTWRLTARHSVPRTATLSGSTS